MIFVMRHLRSSGMKARLPAGMCKAALRALVMAQCALAGVSIAQTPQKPAVDEQRFEIRRFLFEGASALPIATLEEATRAFTGTDRTFADVQGALEAVEKAYTENGYSAIRVTLPEQALERGEVHFEIVEAKIGRILVEGNKYFERSNIVASIPSVTPGGVPNIRAIARNLRVANESPAKQTNILLRAREEATVDALVRVTDEPYKRWSATVDTAGTKETGRFRVGFGHQNANMFDRDQVLTLQYVTAPHSETDPNALSFFPSKRVFILGAGYRIPLYDSGDTIDVTAGYSNVGSGTVANLFTITGSGGLFGLRYTKNLDKIGNYEQRLVFSWDYRGYHNKGVRLLDGTTQVVRDVTVHPVGVTYVGHVRRQDSESAFSFGFSKNLPGGNDGTAADLCAPLTIDGVTPVPPVRSGGSGECANASYFIWRWGLSHTQALASGWQARFAMNGQATRDILVTGEQFGLGGADSVRGFLEREISNDNGYRGTMELYTPDIGGKTGVPALRMRALLFADWGALRRNRPLANEAHAQHIGSIGVGVRLFRGTDLSLRVDYATVLDAGGGRGIHDDRIHASFSYVF